MKNIRDKVIIQIGGYKRSGKDTISQMIANHYQSSGKLVDIFHYADPLKQIAASIFDVSLEQLDEFKNNKTALIVEKKSSILENIEYEIKSETKEDDIFAKQAMILLNNNLRNIKEFEKLTDFREILMKIGNEAIKPVFGSDVWQKIMLEKIEKSEADIIIIPDFRFTVEHIQNAVTVRINNSDIINDTDHQSETELIDFDFDMSIDNTNYSQNQEEVSYYCEQMIDNYIKQKHGDMSWKK